MTLFDRCIDVEWEKPVTYREDARTGRVIERPVSFFKLITRQSGIKPDIDVKMKLLPGGEIVLGLTVTVKNMVMPADVNIREMSRMTVQMGYFNSNIRQTFQSTIFRSYKSSPDPDGESVFEGVIVGNVIDRLWSIPVQLDLFKQACTPSEVVNAFASAYSNTAAQTGRALTVRVLKGFAKDLDSTAYRWYNLEPVSATQNSEVRKHTVWTAGNALAGFTWLLHWLQRTADPYGLHIYGALEGDTFFISCQECENPIEVKTLKDIPIIDMVYNLSFDGVLLNISAPWIPLLHTGDIIYVKPSFFSQTVMPNTVAFVDESCLYRILTMEIHFSTVGANEMSIVALPYKYTAKDEIPKVSSPTYKLEPIPDKIQITIGQPFSDTKEVKVVEASGELVTIDASIYTNGISTFSQVAELYYASLSFPPFDARTMLTKEDPRAQKVGRIRQNSLWPLIVMASINDLQCTPIDMRHPSVIKKLAAGKPYVYKIVKLEKWSDLQNYKEIFKTVMSWCDVNEHETSWTTWHQEWETIIGIDAGWWL